MTVRQTIGQQNQLIVQLLLNLYKALCGNQSSWGERAVGREVFRSKVVRGLEEEPFQENGDGREVKEGRWIYDWQSIFASYWAASLSWGSHWYWMYIDKPTLWARYASSYKHHHLVQINPGIEGRVGQLRRGVFNRYSIIRQRTTYNCTYQYPSYRTRGSSINERGRVLTPNT